MSRTYRKKEKYQYEFLYWDWVRVGGFSFHKVRKQPTPSELAKVFADGRSIHYCCPKRSHREYFNAAHRKFRNNDRKQIAKIRQYNDLEDYEFDISEPTAKYKGVMWEIY